MKWIFVALMLVFGGMSAYAGSTHNKDATSEVIVTRAGMTGNCSGFHIGEGRVITARHCFPGQFSTQADLAPSIDGHPGVFAWIDGDLDIVELQSDWHKEKPVARFSCTTPLPSSTVSAIGIPSGIGYFQTWGRVATGVISLWVWDAVIVHTAVLTPGSSGGPLYNEGGEVVGVNVGGKAGEPLYYAVPLSAFCDKLNSAPT